MKSKTGIIVAVVVLVLLLAIGGFVYANSFFAKNNPAETENPLMKNSEKTGSVFSSIQDALAKNVSLTCTFKTEAGTQTNSYIKNGMIRVNVTGTTPDQDGAVIMRDGKMYFWNSKSAIMMSFDMKEMQKNAVSVTPGAQNPQDYVNMMEKYKESCKTAVVSDDLFTIPANVKFQDVSQMMKNLQNGAGSNSTVPSGAVPSINPSNYQQMMQQYQNQAQP